MWIRWELANWKSCLFDFHFQCIKFVYSHGVMTEGIYRKAGSNININKLLAQFRSNAWAVQIIREEYR